MSTQQTRAATALHLLSARQVLAAPDGDHADGGGLFLRVRSGNAAWVLRYTSPAGRRRESGLGTAHRGSASLAGASLTAARDSGHRAREQLRQGVDPIDARDQHRRVQQQVEVDRKAVVVQQRWTLARCVRDYHERVIEPSRTVKHAAQWIASLENHVAANVWNAPIDSIEAPTLLVALLDVKPHERARNVSGDKVPETVQRIRQRLDAVFEDAAFHKRCSGNPAAAIKRKMREASGRRERGQFKALSYAEAPILMRALQAADGVAARCLELAMLTAARTSEALLAEWSEFDLVAGTWVLPPQRMKAGKAHTVWLPPRAMALLKSMHGFDERFVFPSTMPNTRGKPMSNMAMLAVLGRLGYRDRTTVHGLCRATFSTWANETAAARPDVIEACLAHEEGNRVRAAYNRAHFNAERQALLLDWSEYLAREPAGVVTLMAA